MIQNGTAKLWNTALFSCSTGIQSQDAKGAFLIAFKASTCLFLSWRVPSVIRFPDGPLHERITTAALEATFRMIEIKAKQN